MTTKNKPDETVARAYAAVAGIDWLTVRDWYCEDGSIVFVTMHEKTDNRGWAD